MKADVPVDAVPDATPRAGCGKHHLCKVQQVHALSVVGGAEAACRGQDRYPNLRGRGGGGEPFERATWHRQPERWMDLKRVPVSVESGHEEPKRVERGRGRGRRMDDAGGKDARTREEEEGWGGRLDEFRDLSQRPSSISARHIRSAICRSSLRPPAFWAGLQGSRNSGGLLIANGFPPPTRPPACTQRNADLRTIK